MASSEAVRDAVIVITFLQLLEDCGHKTEAQKRAWMRARFRRASVQDMPRAEVLRATQMLREEKSLGV